MSYLGSMESEEEIRRLRPTLRFTIGPCSCGHVMRVEAFVEHLPMMIRCEECGRALVELKPPRETAR